MKTFAKYLSTLSMGTVMGCSPIPVINAPARPLSPVATIPLGISHPQSSQETIDAERRDIAHQVMAPSAYLVAISPNVYELRDSAAPPRVRVASVAEVDAAKPQRGDAVKPPVSGASTCASMQGVKIEISNGAGIRLLARRTAMRLASSGVATARLTNQPRFDLARTEIQFAAGQEGAASALSALLPAAVKSVPSRNLAKNTAMRLVLGRDFAGDRTALWLDPEAGDMNRRVAVVAPPMKPEVPANCKV